MAYIGKIPAAAALTSSDIADSIITEAKMADDAISLAELKAGTDGEIISWDASGNPVAIGAGTSGHFLKSQGAGSQPVFAASSSDWVKIKSITASDDATIEFVNGASSVILDSTYVIYKFFYYLVIPASDTANLTFEMSTDAGTTWDAPTGVYRYLQANSGATSNDAPSYTSTGRISGQGVGNASGENCAGEVTLFNPSASTVKPLVWFSGASEKDNAKRVSTYGTLRHEAVEDVDSARFKFSSGNITSGSFVLYGLKGG
jgi:hypothetical protein